MIEPLLNVLGLTGVVIFFFVSVLFLISLLLKRNDIADVAWGTGIFLVSLLAYLESSKDLLHTTLLVLAALWGFRLSIRIFLRNRKKSEDYRYKQWRDSWGKWFYIRSYLQVYLLQGFLMVVVGYSFVHASVFSITGELNSFVILGALVWLIGYFFEVIGDYQLDTYLAQKEKPEPILTTGLWKYSRHPNYFGEVTMWWGIWLIIAPLPLSFIALVSPLTITFLILKVSGIPMLEKKFEGMPAFESYKARTSAFFPLPPKSE